VSGGYSLYGQIAQQVHMDSNPKERFTFCSAYVATWTKQDGLQVG